MDRLENRTVIMFCRDLGKIPKEALHNYYWSFKKDFCQSVMVLAVFGSLYLSENSSDLHQTWSHDGELIRKYADIFLIAMFYHILKLSS